MSLLWRRRYDALGRMLAMEEGIGGEGARRSHRFAHKRARKTAGRICRARPSVCGGGGRGRKGAVCASLFRLVIDLIRCPTVPQQPPLLARSLALEILRAQTRTHAHRVLPPTHTSALSFVPRVSFPPPPFTYFMLLRAGNHSLPPPPPLEREKTASASWRRGWGVG